MLSESLLKSNIITALSQGLKRLMTKCQQYFPTDPSRSVDFQRREEPGVTETKKEAPGASLRKVAFTSEKGEALEAEESKTVEK